ncbi:unnamed protein product [Hyaloperonospora brassicae]|uniref:RxLR effector candidate protein n=1 Tax=Hyaloperonospora brassicae TaxID=162125 RepID=A0AAV0TWC7_HYABA|nr:unnamed protein product [Hyaloperonospora brassicae]
MGMACDVEGRAVTGGHEVLLPKTNHLRRNVQSNATTTEAETSGLNPEETAMILTSLSKGFSPVQTTTRYSVMEAVDDMAELSNDDDDEQEASQHHCPFLAAGATASKMQRVQQINFDGPRGSKLDFTDDAGFSHRFRNESNRVKSLVTKHISIDELRVHFDRPIIDVAKDFGICITLMKKICRRNGIKRWPHRQIRSLSKSIASMEAAMLSAHGNERDKYRDQIINLKMKREAVIAEPNKDNSIRPKTCSPPLINSVSIDQTIRARQLPLSIHVSPRPVYATHASPQTSSAPVTPTVKMEKLMVGLPGPTPPSSTFTTGPSKGGRWTSDEHAAFLEGIRLYGKDWRRVAQVVRTRSAVQTRTHAQKYLLKFAGRFPFDTDSMLKRQPPPPVPSQPMPCAPETVNKLGTPTLSPTSELGSSDAAAATPSSDKNLTSGSWNSFENDPQESVQHSERPYVTLDSSRLQLESEVVSLERENVRAPVLPPLSSHTTFEAERTASAAFQPHSHPLEAAPAPFQYLRCNNSRVP